MVLSRAAPMNFALTEAQKEIFDRVSDFASKSLNRDARARDNEHRFGRREWDLCSGMGLAGLNAPTTYGGLGLDCLTTAIALEALGTKCDDMGLAFSLSSHLFGGITPLVDYGSDEQKTAFLPALANGARIAATAVTESAAGSDVFSMRSTAQRDGDHYRIDGEKTYVTNGPIADVFIVFASTSPGGGFRGISAFVIERGTPGLRIGEPFEKIGLRTSPMSSIYFEDCRVPVANLLGTEGAGAMIFSRSMLWERSCEFATYVGAMQRQLDRTIEFARTRKQGNQAIGSYQAVSHRIANMSLRLESARLLLYRACWLIDQGDEADKAVSMAKVAISEASVQSAQDAIQIHGANGIIQDYEIERFLRDAVPSTITSGTSEIQRNIIARALGVR